MGLGQFTGPRLKYAYENDLGATIVLRLDATNVIADSAMPVYDPAVNTEAIGKPLGFKPRGVYWQATAAGFEGKRKFLICGDPLAVLYSSDVSRAVTIDGVAGITTGRRGEVQSFL